MNMFFSILKKVKEFISNPNNKNLIYFLIVLGLVLIILTQRSCSNNLKQKLDAQSEEIQRVKNNYEAEKDSIRHYKLNDSIFRAERLGFVITLKELSTDYKYLLSGFEDFKKNPPKTIINQPILIRETIKEVPVLAKVGVDGVGEFSFLSEIQYPDNNYRKLSGVIPFSSKFFNKKDSSEVDYKTLPYSFDLNPGSGNFNLEQKVNVKLGLFEDPKTKKVKIAINTSYPGITFTGVEAFDILDEDLIKKQQKDNKKTWGLGFNIGYGALYNTSSNKVFVGPQIGIGLHYTPKILQWGK